MGDKEESDFEELVKPLRGQVSDPDAHVNVILSDGSVLRFQDVDASKLSKGLMRYGYAELTDDGNNRCFLFARNVSAIVAGKEINR